MNLVAISQRVELYDDIGERRDALDQRWSSLLTAAELIPILLPNTNHVAKQLIKSLPIKGIILTGGNNLVGYEGDAPERDQLEQWLMNYATSKNLPLLGVCRGMQVIQQSSGVCLHKVSGHVNAEQIIEINGNKECVNSYHNWGAYETPTGFNLFAKSKDGVVKGIVNGKGNIMGIMWHPERIIPHREADIQILKRLFIS
jgi:putative glutamine amidotransferase